jgi:hypothetical protein
MEKISRFFGKWTIPLILLVCVWTSSNVNWGKERWKFVIISDGKGYYAYLPAAIIYHDLNLGFFDTIEKKYYDKDTKYDYRTGSDGKVIDKYFCGVSVLQLPFFLTGHLITKISGGVADGYSKWYAILMCIGAIFYLGIGLVYLRKLLKMFGAEIGIASFVVAVIVFGTNLFYYTLFEPCMSHVYSFAIVTIFLVYAKKWMDSGKKKYVLYSAFLLGMIILIRPVNGMIILWLPFAAGSFNLFFKRIKEIFYSPNVLSASVILFLYVISIQFTIYYLETGHFFINAYGTEKFDFLNPEICNFLFSYKKGLFVYLPITFISLFGFIPMWKQDKFRAIYLFIMLFLFIYILSCWWMWYYGGSFGTRVMVEFLPLFAILLFYLIRSLNLKIVRTSLISLVVIVTLFCQFQTLQYRFFVIHWSEMNKEKYWDVFLNADFLKKK